jgi:hypothetical protein
MTPKQDCNDRGWIKDVGEQQKPTKENRIKGEGKLLNS